MMMMMMVDQVVRAAQIFQFVSRPAWQETLPAEVLQKLNATMSASESRYSGAVVTCLKLGSGTSWDQSPDLKLLAQLKRDQDAEGWDRRIVWREGSRSLWIYDALIMWIWTCLPFWLLLKQLPDLPALNAKSPVSHGDMATRQSQMFCQSNCWQRCRDQSCTLAPRSTIEAYWRHCLWKNHWCWYVLMQKLPQHCHWMSLVRIPNIIMIGSYACSQGLKFGPFPMVFCS